MEPGLSSPPNYPEYRLNGAATARPAICNYNAQEQSRNRQIANLAPTERNVYNPQCNWGYRRPYKLAAPPGQESVR